MKAGFLAQKPSLGTAKSYCDWRQNWFGKALWILEMFPNVGEEEDELGPLRMKIEQMQSSADSAKPTGFSEKK